MLYIEFTYTDGPETHPCFALKLPGKLIVSNACFLKTPPTLKQMPPPLMVHGYHLEMKKT